MATIWPAGFGYFPKSDFAGLHCSRMEQRACSAMSTSLWKNFPRQVIPWAAFVLSLAFIGNSGHAMICARKRLLTRQRN